MILASGDTGPSFLVGPLAASVGFLCWYKELRFHRIDLFSYRPQPGFHTPLLYGLKGLRISPGKGLFVFDPLAVVGVVGLVVLFVGSSSVRDRALGPLCLLLIVPRLSFSQSSTIGLVAVLGTPLPPANRFIFHVDSPGAARVNPHRNCRHSGLDRVLRTGRARGPDQLPLGQVADRRVAGHPGLTCVADASRNTRATKGRRAGHPAGRLQLQDLSCLGVHNPYS